MVFSHNDVRAHLDEFVTTAGLEWFFDAQKIEQAATVAKRALEQWPNQMALTLTNVSVDWKGFSLSISRSVLYDVYFLVGAFLLIKLAFIMNLTRRSSSDLNPTMRSQIRWRHLQQQVLKTAEIIHPFGPKGIWMLSCDASCLKTLNGNADGFAYAFRRLRFDNALLVGQALRQKFFLPFLLERVKLVRRPSLVYIFTTVPSYDGQYTLLCCSLHLLISWIYASWNPLKVPALDV
ncbi:hypothetical protein GP486_001040 [Trichoglossum hirsutum]|uniref:Uncharacterized protein n=1 Tax=Trichoglossum hirsutum TaxID=265104 RepID=A0A9P8RSZ8_9PEZI|nr:hypothetical protein GP486_001040 [Trichoglossum hirsutum]